MSAKQQAEIALRCNKREQVEMIVDALVASNHKNPEYINEFLEGLMQDKELATKFCKREELNA